MAEQKAAVARKKNSACLKKQKFIARSADRDKKN